MKDLSNELMPYSDVRISEDGKSFEIKIMTNDEFKRPSAGCYITPTESKPI